MPLEHSSSPASFKRNVSTLMGEIGRSPHVANPKQALAIAFATKRRAEHADGDGVIPFARQVGGPINPAMLRPPMPGMAPPGNVMPMGVAGPANMPFMRPPGRAGGGFNIAKWPNLSPPNYFERGEARDMMHGPIVSTSPGRADTHFMRVPSGSYVLPSQTVAGLGGGNSLAGLKIANNIFGLNGPYGISNPKFGHGPGAPKPPRGIAFATGGYTSEGGARGHDDHKPVDVMLSGGEMVIHPAVVRAIGQGSIENGHKILDHFVLLHRKRDIERQKKLPPPAKK